MALSSILWSIKRNTQARDRRRREEKRKHGKKGKIGKR